MLAEIIFLILALVIIVGAFKMLAASEPVHAAVYLGLVLAGVAGIYLTLGAEFLAAIQILIYVGAVVTLILFAVLLTTPVSTTEGFGEDRTPLSVLGLDDAPRGMDVESMAEVPSDVETISEAEAAADEAAETEDGGTIQPSDEDDGDPEEPPEGDTEAEDADPSESAAPDEPGADDQPSEDTSPSEDEGSEDEEDR